jgi:hypothetical protein
MNGEQTNKEAPSTEQHPCFVSAKEQLGKRNTKLSFAMQIADGESRLVIATEKVARGPKPVLMLANFCPFCGAHLP